MRATSMFASLSRAVACSALLVVASDAALAQIGTASPDAPVIAPAPTGIVRQIDVRGTQRIEVGTVLSYIGLREGDTYDEQIADRALKTLFATGLFADVKVNWNGSVLTVTVVENPILNQVVFEGNDKVTEKDLNKEVQLKPRTIFTRAKVQADVQRIIELYRRNGKFAASVDPQIIQRPQNRVDLIFSIDEGDTTGVARISFIGNKVYDDDTLRGQISTRESAWWRFLSSSDNYDPDRLTFDREQLRRFYVNHGYADFRIASAVAELTPDRKDFYITFTLDEGRRYRFGKVEIDSTVKELPARNLRPVVRFNPGEIYNAELVQKSIDALTNAAGTKGYAFAEVHPRIRRDRAGRLIDVIFKIEQGPRVYIEKINITGNTRTLDKVIRREFRLVEGDAFNRVLIDRSRTRIRGLGFFKNVDIKNTPGSQPDRANVTVAVTEQSTGELSLGAGYSSTASFVGEFSYTERNLFGRGQYVRGSVSISSFTKQFQASFTEPYFLDRPIAAGIDLYKVLTNFDQAAYQGDTSAVGLRFGFPTSEYGSIGLRYTYKIDDITPYLTAPLQVQLAAGTTHTSAFGYTFAYNTLDDQQRPTNGFVFSFSQDLAGLGGSLKYLRNEAAVSFYRPVFWESMIGSIGLNSGYITGWGGQTIPLNERFFKGGDSFRGFALAGIGPRDLAIVGNGGAVGGNFYAIGSTRLRLPSFLPEDYGITTALFSEFGTLGHLDTPIPACNMAVSCIVDKLSLRASAGLSVGWKSPFGPIQIDFGIPILKTSYDKSQIIHFSAGTGL